MLTPSNFVLWQLTPWHPAGYIHPVYVSVTGVACLAATAVLDALFVCKQFNRGRRVSPRFVGMVSKR